MSIKNEQTTGMRIEVVGFGKVLIHPRGKKRIFSVSFHHDGKHKRKTLGTADWDQAVTKMPIVLDQVTGYREHLKGDVGLAEGLEIYVEYLLSNNRPERTVQQVRTRVNAFYHFLNSQAVDSFSQIRKIHADHFRAHLLASKSPSTAFGYYRVVKSMIRYLVSRSLLAADPFKGIYYNRPGFRHAIIPTLDQVNKVLEAVDKRYVIPISSLAFVGCRREELANITFNDVDLRTDKICIRKPTEVSSKTVTREVPIHSRLKTLFECFRRPRSKWYFCTLPSARSKGGKKLKTDFLNNEFKRAAKSVGIPVGRSSPDGMTLHSLRGFFKSHALHSGVPREVVDTWQGHRNDRSASYIHYYDLPWSVSCKWMESINFGTFEKKSPELPFVPNTTRAVYFA